MNENLDELLHNSLFVEALLRADSAADANKLLAQGGVAMEDGDVTALLSALRIRQGEEQELDDADLESVAGGVAAYNWLESLPML